MRITTSKLVGVLAALASASPVLGQTGDLEGAFGSERLISLATGRSQPIRKAPAVAFIITREDIDAIGATTVNQALELVPGFHGLARPQGYQYVFRGIRTRGNESPDVLVLLDGIPQNDIVIGNQRRFISQVPFQLVDRIEVIRGPYSTIYGQDAYAAVINIVTSRADRAEDLLQVRAGSESTGELRVTKRFNVADGLAFSAQFRSTEGHRPFYEVDSQSLLDILFGTDASLAPAEANTDFDDYNVFVDLAVNEWSLRFRARGREAGLGTGLTGAIDPDGRVKDEQYNISASNVAQFGDGWRFNTDVHAMHYYNYSNVAQLFPPGAAFPVLFEPFPDGVFNDPRYKFRSLRAETKGQYLLSERHAPTFGFGAEYIDVYQTSEARNYIPDPISGFPAVPLPRVTAVPQDQVFLAEEDRTLVFAYLDDQWFFAPDWSLTIGARLDYYSDAGEAFNPRAALVWNASPEWTAKLLIGSGFRAPTFLELYSLNTPTGGGNPNLEPVQIVSSEFALNYQPHPSLSIDLSMFYYEIEDLIDEELRPPQGFIPVNSSGQKGYGGDISGLWQVADSFSLYGYYAHQTSEHNETLDSVSLAPEDKILLRADWRPNPKWSLNATTRFVMNRQREADDVRSLPDDYTIVTASIIYQLNNSWSFQIDGDNLLEEEGIIPDDSHGFDVDLWDRRVFLRATWTP